MFHSFIVCFLLGYGGINDYRSRQIPDAVPIGLLILALLELVCGFGCHLIARLSGFGFIFFLIGIIEHLAHQGKGTVLPGGDIKLLLSLSLTEGFTGICGIILFTGLVVCFIWIIPTKREPSVPLCFYIAIAYFILAVLI